MVAVYIIGTLDTKASELRFAKDCVAAAGVPAVLVDVSTLRHSEAADVPADVVAACHPRGADAVFGAGDRGACIDAMGEALSAYLLGCQDMAAVLGLGGSGNTAIVTAAMRALPIGLPKMMLSTMASDTTPYVGSSDIAMMYSVVDVAGLNPISRTIIGNASRAVAGMARGAGGASAAGAPGLGLTMFGVTTPCVTAVRTALQDAWDCYVFSANGLGGRSMEKLVESRMIDAVIDVTTTEVADLLVGGTLPCSTDRFQVIVDRGIPYCGSVGAVDMVNFGSQASVPAQFAGRRFYAHNPQVTLMRTTADENRAIGTWIVERVNRMTGPVRFLLPLRGVSAIDVAGGVFHDPAADAALFSAIREGWQPADQRRLIEIDAHINDPAFAGAIVDHFNAIV